MSLFYSNLCSSCFKKKKKKKKENVRALKSLFQGYPAIKRVKMNPTILKDILNICLFFNSIH